MSTIDLAKVPVVILAGGRGARFDHETKVRPKPMISVCGKPIIQHIIDSFVDQGFREFIIAAGYLGDQIDDHFKSFGRGPFAFGVGDLPWRQYGIEHPDLCGVKVVVVDTGENSHTGRRLGLLHDRGFLQTNFVLTYGDGLSDVDMSEVILRHHTCAGLGPDVSTPWVTMTVVRPPGRFGVVKFWKPQTTLGHEPDDLVQRFEEKVQSDWINGGFMYVDPTFVREHIITDDPWGYNELETRALADLALSRRLLARRHFGFWMCMDTRRDLEQIERAVRENNGMMPWRKKDAP